MISSILYYCYIIETKNNRPFLEEKKDSKIDVQILTVLTLIQELSLPLRHGKSQIEQEREEGDALHRFRRSLRWLFPGGGLFAERPLSETERSCQGRLHRRRRSRVGKAYAGRTCFPCREPKLKNPINRIRIIEFAIPVIMSIIALCVSCSKL